MKKIISTFKKSIRFVVSIFASREFAFIYCLIGTLAQISHTYFLTSHISSFDGDFKTFQAILVSGFISSSLLYFVSIADNTESKESKRVHLAINIFTSIEILINLYYYTKHLIIEAPEMLIFDFMFASIISMLLPYTIKLYANTIRAKEWLEELDTPDTHKIDYNEIEINVSKLKERLDNVVGVVANISNEKPAEEAEQIFNDKMEALDDTISTIFEKNQKLFLQQFENKCKTLINSTNNITPNTKE